MRKNSKFKDSLQQNNYTYRQYIDRLMSLAISMFEWTGLPDSVDPRYIETTLFNTGCAVWFKDELLADSNDTTGGYLCLTCTPKSQFDVYGNPIVRTAYSRYNGYRRELDNKNSVIIWNNELRKNSVLQVTQFARRLYNLDRIIDVNANAQKTPILLTGNETQQLTLRNLYEQYDGGEPVIFGDKNLDISRVSALRTDAPYVCDKIYTLKTQIWNEALTVLGISNVNTSKKERMVTDEIIRNEGGTVANRYSRLNARQQACEKINKMFGLDVWCEFRNDFLPLVEKEVNEEGGEVNG